MILSIIIYALTGTIITYLAIKIAWKVNFLSFQNTIFVSQKKPVAYLGGLAILMTILINLIFHNWLFYNQLIIDYKIALVLSFFTVIGLIDDYFELRPITKSILQVAGAILSVSLGFYVEITHILLVNYMLSVFSLVLIVNAFNLIDVSDGLLVSIFIPMLMFFYVFAKIPILIMITSISIGSFLFYNKPEAKIYLGDSGSHLLGSLAYIFGTSYIDSSFTFDKIMTLILVFSVIIFELAFLIYRRLKQNLSIFKGSPDHYSILLRKYSWSKYKIMQTSFITSLIFVSVACITEPYSLTVKSILVVFTIFIYFLIGQFINTVSYDKK